MTAAQFRRFLDELAEAWRERRYEEAVEMFAPDVRYLDPTRYSMVGRDSLLAFFQDDEGYPQLTTWRNVLFDEATQMGAAEYSYRGTRLYHGVVLINLSAERVARWREYQHTSDLDWQAFFQGAVP